MKIDKKTLQQVHRQARGWGYELWLENMQEYCGKLLVIEAGKKGSMHYHMKKLETMLLVSGHVTLKLIDSDDGKPYNVELSVGDSIRIQPGQAHQICASELSELIEFSTIHEESDSYRIEKGD